MQTHFEGNQLGDELCAELVKYGIHHFRLSAVESNLDQCNVMLAECDRARVNHLLIVQHLDLLKQIKNRNIEWCNEPDGDILPQHYWETFMDAYEICKTNNNRLHGPAISNLDRDSLNWLSAFVGIGIPRDVVITYHHYTPGIYFWQAHKGFSSRQEEMDRLKAIVGNRRIACSESGYNDEEENRQAENIIKEIEFAELNKLEFWTYYQINSDPTSGDNFGVRRDDGSWKPVINSFLAE
jgi:hypothetical protein